MTTRKAKTGFLDYPRVWTVLEYRFGTIPRAVRRRGSLFDIRTLEIIEGRLPRRALVLVLEWAQEHRAELLEDWELCAHNRSPKKIPPLP